MAEEQPKTPKEKLQINIESAKAVVKKAQAVNVTDGSVKSLQQNYSCRSCIKRCEGKRCTGRNDESYIRICDFTR